jgi:hypothetical protein
MWGGFANQTAEFKRTCKQLGYHLGLCFSCSFALGFFLPHVLGDSWSELLIKEHINTQLISAHMLVSASVLGIV